MANPIAAIKTLTGVKETNSDNVLNEKPGFDIDNSYNIMLMTGAATDTRTIIESFL